MSGLQGKRIWAVCAIAVLAGLWVPAASADQILGRFIVVEDNSVSELGDQLAVLVTTSDINVSFQFFNHEIPGYVESRIREIYWDDLNTPEPPPSLLPPLLDYSQAVLPLNEDGITTDWTTDVKPANMPGWETMDPVFTAAFGSEDTEIPASHQGIFPGQSATFTIPYLAPATGQNVIDALLAGSFRLGLHITSIAPDGQSESYATTVYWDPDPEDPFYPPPVPVPAAAGLGFLGMGLVGLVKGYRRIRR